MTLFGFALLADENINPLVVTGKRHGPSRSPRVT